MEVSKKCYRTFLKFLDGTGNVIFGNSSSEERMGGIV